MDYVSLACCLLAFLLYYNTLDAGFVYDDRRAILSNPDLLPTTPLHKLLENDFWGTPLSDSGSHGSYRPLCVLTFRFNYFLGGFQPWGYHLVNVLLHCLATTLIVKVARHVLPKSRTPIGPAVTGLLFASHPLHTEAVAGVVGRADLAACILYLLSFLTYTAHVKYRDFLCCECKTIRLCRDEDRIKQLRGMKYHRFMANLRNQVTNCNWPKKVLPGDSLGTSSSRQGVDFAGVCCWWSRCREWVSLGGCLLLSLGAMLSKETGVMVLGICVLYDFLRIPLLNRKRWRSILVLGITATIMLLARLQGPAPQFATADNPTAKEPRFLTRFLTFAYLPLFNLWLLLYPETLSFDWGMDAIPRIHSVRDPRNFWSALFYLVVGVLVKQCANVLRQKQKPYRSVQSPKQRTSSARDNNGAAAAAATSTTAGTGTTTTTTTTPTLSASNGIIVFGMGIGEDKTWHCPCPVCHHGLSEMHSASCRTNNNNNSTNLHSHSCVCLKIPLRASQRSPIRQKVKGDKAAVLLAIAFLALPFLPASNLLFYVGFVVAERVLYLPSAGWCLLCGIGAGKLWELRKYRSMTMVCVLVVLLAFGTKTVLRNRDWFDEESLYRSAIPMNPPKAYGNLGSVLSSKGNTAEAELAFRKALQFRPNMADVHYNLGVLLQGKHQLNEAIQSFQRAIQFRPSLALAYVNLGAALIAAGRCQEAVSVLRQGSRLDGTGLRNRKEHETARVSALLQLGALYSDQGRLQRALAAYREAAHSLPEHYPPQSVFNVLGETLARLHQDEEAERWYQAALNAQPDHVPAHITYGKLLAKNISRVAEAEQWFRRAQKLAPEDPTVYHHYGEFLASRGRYKEAAVLYEKAAELRPRDYELAVAVATAMRQAGRHEEAERWYRKAVILKPTDARGHTNLGAILHLNGKYREAADSYKEALRLQPNDVTTLTNLHKLHSVMT